MKIKYFFVASVNLFLLSIILCLSGCSSGDSSNGSTKADGNYASSSRITEVKPTPTPTPQQSVNMYSWDDEKADYLKKFKKMMQRTQLADAPYIKGKLVTLYEDRFFDIKYSYDSMLTDLPVDLQAMDPADAETVIYTNWNQIDVGYYRPVGGTSKDDFSALKAIGTLYIIDTTIPAVIGKKTFQGPPPPKEYQTVTFSQDETKKQILEYIKNLPRR